MLGNPTPVPIRVSVKTAKTDDISARLDRKDDSVDTDRDEGPTHRETPRETCGELRYLFDGRMSLMHNSKVEHAGVRCFQMNQAKKREMKRRESLIAKSSAAEPKNRFVRSVYANEGLVNRQKKNFVTTLPKPRFGRQLGKNTKRVRDTNRSQLCKNQDLAVSGVAMSTKTKFYV